MAERRAVYSAGWSDRSSAEQRAGYSVDRKENYWAV